MPDKKLTDNEIVKALECCSYITGVCPEHCPLMNDDGCRNILAEKALEIINRQKAEIERLEAMNQAKLDIIHDLRERLGE